MDILGATGIGMRAILLLKNENCPNHNNFAKEDLIEFYDLRGDQTPDGQFIIAIPLKALNEERHTGDTLVLNDSTKEWQINDRVKGMVIDWAEYILYQTLKEIGCLPKDDLPKNDPPMNAQQHAISMIRYFCLKEVL